ncbi:MAG: anthranilate phosphoribosyltransferase [Bacilli bacterium]
MREYLKRVLGNENLTTTEAKHYADVLLTEADDANIAAALIALKQKGETVEELTGFVQGLTSNSVKIPLPTYPMLFDNCGTGGDGFHTFNLSTTTSFVLAGAGVPVAKHGNRSVSSQCGSADVLEALGANLTPPIERIATMLNETNFVFLLAPYVHPKLANVGRVRRSLGVPTMFNILGPLANPLPITHQLVGVYDERLAGEMVRVLQRLGRQRAAVVAGYEGLDECSLAGPNTLFTLRDGMIQKETLDGTTYGFERTPISAIRGGDAAQNALLLRSVLEGEASAYYDYAVWNAAVCLYVSETVESMVEAVEKAKQSIGSGAAHRVLQQFITLSKGEGVR